VITPRQRNYAHLALIDWAQWNAGHIDQSAIGYPSETVECRMMAGEIGSSLPAHCICPDVMSGPRIKTVGWVVSVLPSSARLAVRWKYEIGGLKTEGERMHGWAKEVNKRPRGYYEELDAVYALISLC